MTDTEIKIKKATIELLLKEGRFGITIHEIAAKSKVSRTVIHYYYRSRERLFSVVVEQILKDYITPRYHLLFSNETLKSKVENYLNFSEKILKKYPYSDIYMMTQFAESDSIRNYVHSIQDQMQTFLAEVQEGIDAKIVKSCNAKDFMTDLFSLSTYSGMYYNFLKVNSSVLSPKDDSDFFNGRTAKIISKLFV